MKLYLLLALLPLLIVFIPSEAATPQYGIALSKTCVTMIKNNLPTDCPTYDKIMVLFPDRTDQKVSGEFKIIDGVYQRGTPLHLNPWKYYYFAKEPTLWIDPPSDVRSRIKMIYIESSLPEYKIGNESLKMDDYTISFQKDRYINPNCSEIKITAKNWVFLTGDSLNVIKNNCDKSVSKFDGTVTKEFIKSYQDISTSFKYKYDLWVKENLIKCKVKGC